MPLELTQHLRCPERMFDERDGSEYRCGSPFVVLGYYDEHSPTHGVTPGAKILCLGQDVRQLSGGTAHELSGPTDELFGFAKLGGIARNALEDADRSQLDGIAEMLRQVREAGGPDAAPILYMEYQHAIEAFAEGHTDASLWAWQGYCEHPTRTKTLELSLLPCPAKMDGTYDGTGQGECGHPIEVLRQYTVGPIMMAEIRCMADKARNPADRYASHLLHDAIDRLWSLQDIGDVAVMELSTDERSELNELIKDLWMIHGSGGPDAVVVAYMEFVWKLEAFHAAHDFAPLGAFRAYCDYWATRPAK